MRNGPEHNMPPDPLEEVLRPEPAATEFQLRVHDLLNMLKTNRAQIDDAKFAQLTSDQQTSKVIYEAMQAAYEVGRNEADISWINAGLHRGDSEERIQEQWVIKDAIGHNEAIPPIQSRKNVSLRKRVIFTIMGEPDDPTPPRKKV